MLADHLAIGTENSDNFGADDNDYSDAHTSDFEENGSSSHGELSMVVNPHPSTNINANAGKERAIIYLDTVRQRLKRSNPDLFYRFLDIMKDFRAQMWVVARLPTVVF